MTIRRRLLRFVRKLHIWVGLSAALYFMLIAATGVMINHREGLLLEDRTISRRWLPSNYRPDDGIAGVRADIAVADLHSGLIFGKAADSEKAIQGGLADSETSKGLKLLWFATGSDTYRTGSGV